jgi:hypothetical protein
VRYCANEKKSFLNFACATGQKMPVETSPTRQWAPACWKAMIRDELPSKRCVSGQPFCSVVISAKSTGIVAAVVATSPVD